LFVPTGVSFFLGQRFSGYFFFSPIQLLCRRNLYHELARTPSCEEEVLLTTTEQEKKKQQKRCKQNKLLKKKLTIDSRLFHCMQGSDN